LRTWSPTVTGRAAAFFSLMWRRVSARVVKKGTYLTPSAADIDMTRQVIDAGRTLRIAVHDHLVVGRDGVASFKALGLI
jgi:RadC-like JAB domain